MTTRVPAPSRLRACWLRQYALLCAVGLCLALAAGCAPTVPAQVAAMRAEHGFSEVHFAAPPFTLYGLLRAPASPPDTAAMPAHAADVPGARPGASAQAPAAPPGALGTPSSAPPAATQITPASMATLHVYIEGDGYAWQSRTRPSADPTPRDSVTLRLARADASGAPVLYLARPCQFGTSPACPQRYWTSARFAPEVLAALDSAITQARARTGARTVTLVGYSGGGALAVLLAAQRDDVRFVGTVAGTLDHAAWTRLHKVSPMTESLNAVDVAARVAHLPQRHMSSRADTTMPPQISSGFCAATGRPETCVVVDGISHNGAWEGVWRTP